MSGISTIFDDLELAVAQAWEDAWKKTPKEVLYCPQDKRWQWFQKTFKGNKFVELDSGGEFTVTCPDSLPQVCNYLVKLFPKCWISTGSYFNYEGEGTVMKVIVMGTKDHPPGTIKCAGYFA